MSDDGMSAREAWSLRIMALCYLGSLATIWASMPAETYLGLLSRAPTEAAVGASRVLEFLGVWKSCVVARAVLLVLAWVIRGWNASMDATRLSLVTWRAGQVLDALDFVSDSVGVVAREAITDLSAEHARRLQAAQYVGAQTLTLHGDLDGDD